MQVPRGSMRVPERRAMSVGRGRRRVRVPGVAVMLAGVLAAAPLWAHHSTAMFDTTRTVTLQATVKTLQWSNPHAWLQLLVPDERGQAVEWGVEMGNPASMLREGWRVNSVKPGDQVTVVISPLKSGEHGGSLISVKRADGSVVGGRR